MRWRFLVNVVPLFFFLAIGAGGGAVLAEVFVERYNVPSGDPLELVGTGIFLVGVGFAVCWYLVWMSAIKRMSGRAASRGPEADYDDRP